jgi:hypothetical protein
MAAMRTSEGGAPLALFNVEFGKVLKGGCLKSLTMCLK